MGVRAGRAKCPVGAGEAGQPLTSLYQCLTRRRRFFSLGGQRFTNFFCSSVKHGENSPGSLLAFRSPTYTLASGGASRFTCPAGREGG